MLLKTVTWKTLLRLFLIFEASFGILTAECLLNVLLYTYNACMYMVTRDQKLANKMDLGKLT